MAQPVVVVLAGGQGQRFWPRSRRGLPKQFLTLTGGASLLQETWRRALLLTAPSRIWVLTTDRHAGLVRSHLPDLEPDNLLVEPEGRDTAPALALAAAVALRRGVTEPLVCLPSDHYVAGDEPFAAALSRAAQVAQMGFLVTVGLRPSRPETGYGYLVCDPTPLDGGPPAVLAVRRFREKPSLEEAQTLLGTPGTLWNGGMFAWEPQAFLREVARRLPGVARVAEALAGAEDPAQRGRAAGRYRRLTPISVDRGVMEGAREVATVVGEFVWDDVGSWNALARLWPADEGGNVLLGRSVAIDSRGVLVDAQGSQRLVVAFGVDDLVVADTQDALLVTHKGRTAELKQVAESLGRLGLHRYTDRSTAPLPIPPGSRVVAKPWGREVWWAVTPSYAGKLLEVNAGEALSLQYHEVKRETLWVLAGEGLLTLGERQRPVRPGACLEIPPGTVHRLAAHTDMVVLELSSPELDDVVRLEDRYGRAPGDRARPPA